ncbi:unnamed protein product [Microthlaspi erraticum]|uniref:Uncharacterized protein n=1 Tax=Microthlaspi erraticum TaxID=1685480 RepID=A0A6D2K3D8_9BRAS|nr:unnamed protein product [Microthlaspi erraticum]
MAIANILDRSTTAYKPLKDHLMPIKRERSPTPNHPPFYCNAITRRSTTQVHEDNEEEEREYEEQLMMKMKSRASTSMLPQNRAWIHLALDPRFSPRSQASTLPRLEAMQRPSPPTEEEDTWQYDPIDPNKISPMKLKEFNAKVKSLPFYVTFEEAWDKHGLVEFFFTTSENKEEIHQLFQKARFPLAPHAVNQPPSPPSHHHRGMSIPYQERSLLSSISLSKLFQPACLPTSLAPLPIHHLLPQLQETPEDIKSFLRKLKFSLPSRPSTRLKTQVNSLFPVK